MRLATVALAACLLVPSLALGQGAQPRLVNIGPDFVDFGTVNIGSAVVVPISVRNLTPGALTLAGGGIGGGVGFTGVGSTCGASIAAGATCTLTYRFRPQSADGSLVEDDTSVTFTGGGRSQTAPLSFAGRGNGTLLHVAPRVIDYGELLLGDTASVRVNIVNLGSENVSFAGGGFTTQNGFFGNTGCPPSLAPGASCFVQYSFQPTQLGLVENAASVNAVTAGVAISQSYSIEVRGRGISTVPIVAIHPITFDFGDVTVADQYNVEVKYKNLGASIVTYAGGAAPAPFEGLPATGPGCGANSADPGVTCTFSYLFRPLATGLATATAGLTFSRPGGSQNVTLDFRGNGIGLVGRVTPQVMDLGQVRLGTSISVPVTVTNTTRLPIGTFIGGAVAAPFSSSNNCPSSLPVGQSCQYTFTFTASASSLGAQTAQTSISFTNTDNVQPVYNITLLATGYDRVFADGFE